MIKNQRGIITLDFVFALTLAMGFTAILFAMSFTLSVVEVTQYITFSAARSYFGAHISPQEQEKLAIKKYQNLIANQAIGSFYRNGWFEVPEKPEIRDFSSDYGAKSLNNNGGAPFIGIRILLNAKMLAFRIPFYGSTTTDDDAFQTNVASFLAREPSSMECKNFMGLQRFNAIKQLDPRRFSEMSKISPNGNTYISITDNGC